MTFGAFERLHRQHFAQWARWFYDRWPQQTLDLGDLVQEMMIACWRAIDAWDPAKTPDIEKYVKYQVGARARQELERVLGWPRKGRRAAIRLVPLDDHEPPALNPARSIHEGAWIVPFLGDLGRDVVGGVLSGFSLDVVAQRLYRDTDRRLRYRWDCQDDAIRSCHRAARLIVDAIDGSRIPEQKIA